MAKTSPYSKRVLGVKEQLARVRALYPQFHSGVDGATLTVEGLIQPTEASVPYRVRIEYAVGNTPQVTVVDPVLRPREENGRIPHVYPGNKLCLYLPNSGEWTPDRSLPHSFVPWIAEWLLHYEVWLVTGVWCGGGVDPHERETIRRDEESAT
jgi:hypothetical protein